MSNKEGGKKPGLVELSKKVDKWTFYLGTAIYVLIGVPVALAIAAFGGISWGGTAYGEKLYKEWKAKRKSK